MTPDALITAAVVALALIGAVVLVAICVRAMASLVELP